MSCPCHTLNVRCLSFRCRCPPVVILTFDDVTNGRGGWRKSRSQLPSSLSSNPSSHYSCSLIEPENDMATRGITSSELASSLAVLFQLKHTELFCSDRWSSSARQSSLQHFAFVWKKRWMGGDDRGLGGLHPSGNFDLGNPGGAVRVLYT